MKNDLTNIALINVVFLLMVFFLLVGSRYLPVIPPPMDGALSESIPTKGAIITLTANGKTECNLGDTQQCLANGGAVNIQADGKAKSADLYALIKNFTSNKPENSKLYLTVRSK